MLPALGLGSLRQPSEDVDIAGMKVEAGTQVGAAAAAALVSAVKPGWHECALSCCGCCVECPGLLRRWALTVGLLAAPVTLHCHAACCILHCSLRLPQSVAAMKGAAESAVPFTSSN